MCGRYASARSRSELLETFKIEEAFADEEKAPGYNVAPTKTPAVVLARPPRDDKDAEPVRQLRNLKWVPAQLHRPGPENLSAGRTCPGRYHRAG
jgi:putative SOS response-associated peptidase YedK